MLEYLDKKPEKPVKRELDWSKEVEVRGYPF